MSAIEWDGTLVVGITKVDEQHEKLILLTQQLEQAIFEKRAAETIEDTLAELFNYAQRHFEMEEKLFQLFHYPEREIHELEHRRFIAKIFDFKERLEQGNPRLYQQLLAFLSGWIGSHIEISDKRYAPFMIKHGVS